MTVKFRDPLSAQACLIVSAFQAFIHYLTDQPYFVENGWAIFRWPSDRG